jgi:ketosteroid isomerase-like protein
LQTQPWPGDTARAVSQENVEIVRDAFQTFGAEGIDAALSYFSADFVWYPTDKWLEGDAYRGHDGMRRLEAAFSENFDDFRYEVRHIREAQDRVVALVDMIGRIKPSLVEVSQRLGFVVSGFGDGTFREVRAFPSWQEALEAVGLSE